MKRKLVLLAACLCVALLSLAVSVFLFPRVHPLGAFHPVLSRAEVLERASAIMKDVGASVTGYESAVRLSADDALMKEMYTREGVASANQSMRESVPAFFWIVTWRGPEGVAGNVSEPPRRRSSGGGPELPQRGFEVQLDMRGHLLAMSVPSADSASVTPLDSASARGLAEKLLSSRCAFSGIRFTRERRIELPNRIEREVTFAATDTTTREELEASVRIVGSRVGGFSISRAGPPLEEMREASLVRYVLLVFLYLGIGVVAVIAAIRRIRAYEIGFRYAYVLGAVAALLEAVTKAASMESFSGWSSVVDITLVPLLVGGAFTLLWIVGESISRETFREKFVSLDLITNGHPFHSQVGGDLLKGIAAGIAAIAFSLMVIWLGEQLFPVWFVGERQAGLSILSSGNPLLYGIAGRLLSALFVLAFVLMSFLGILRKRVSSAVLLTLAGAFVLGVPNTMELRPDWLGITVSMLSSLVLVWVLLRSSLLAGLTALLIWHLSDSVLAFLVAGHPAFVPAGTGFLLVGGAFFVIGSVSLLSKDRAVDLDSMIPDFARHITERERLQQELEVARKVQMSFLPKEDPKVPGLDIASRCVPALEVGGDYYDFVPLGDDTLGIAVGDVSGKGIQASFYMTLAKGFLRAVARGMRSPALVLKGANELFSENVEKGTFISMVYGIADLRAKTFTFARAGHSLVILKRASEANAELLRSSGMALGLEQSEQFAESLEEVRLVMQSGDLTIIYTDGFTEAMDSKREEFGEERLLSAVRQHAQGNAREILDGVFGEVKSFVRKHEQHDDMTIVVIKWT